MSASNLTREQILDLLKYLDATKIVDKGRDNIQFTCTVHGENNPSAGVSVSKQVFNCWSCHAKGSISYLVYKSKPDEFKNIKEVDTFILDRYGVAYISFDKEWANNGLLRYEDFYNIEEEVRFTTPRSKLAPFRSGKETYQYFFDRGFNSKDVQDFMIGRDLIQKTITIPIFWEDETLAGIIGRKIDSKISSNMRYKVYDFPKSNLLYPLNKYKSERGRVVLVEGNLDAIWCHKHGFSEVLAMQTNSLSKEQVSWIVNNCSEVVDLSDNDKMGYYASQSIEEGLKRKVRLLSAKHLYPDSKKDPQECTYNELKEMMCKAKSKLLNKIVRI